jgi:pimeloyl-ACP methyl ester carboxylesterase
MRTASRQVDLLEGHGHWVMHEDPERIAALVIPFPRSLLPPERN